jgi:hypothetical protein
MAFCWPVATTFAKQRALDGNHGIPWLGPMLATRGYMGLPDAVLERGRRADAPVNDGLFVRWELQPQPFGCGALRPGEIEMRKQIVDPAFCKSRRCRPPTGNRGYHLSLT